MMSQNCVPALLCVLMTPAWVISSAMAGKISTVEQLVAAVDENIQGSTITLGAGVFELQSPLELKTGMTLIGAGMGETIITHDPNWKPSTTTLPKGEMRPDDASSDAYLIRPSRNASDITIAHLTLRGPQMHGAIFSVANQCLHLHHLRIEDVLYSGIRGYHLREARIHDCEFIGAGGKWKQGGVPGIDGGVSGGAIFVTWMHDSEIAHNRFHFGPLDRRPGKSGGHFGIKGRGGRNIRIHHNTIGVNFSIEFPFEGNRNMQIDHNVLHGVVSVPKHAGGAVLQEDERSFHIHHNYFTTSYAIEFPRNNVEIDHNLFDFDVTKDGGNLISGFGGDPSPGPAWFHNNLVSNPGRGVIWIERAFTNLVIRNNHIIARTTPTPRRDGLFGLGGTDFRQTQIVNNLVECRGLPRPLLRNQASYGAEIRNNRLINISDVDQFDNESSGETIGLERPLQFRCGVHEEMIINGWTTRSEED